MLKFKLVRDGESSENDMMKQIRNNHMAKKTMKDMLKIEEFLLPELSKKGRKKEKKNINEFFRDM